MRPGSGPPRYEVIGIAGLPEVHPGADIARLVVEAAARQSTPLTGGDVFVIVADTFGRPWREGLTNVAIGLAGLTPLRSYLGERDPAGRPLQATILAVADELAAAAEPVMGKLDRIPAAIVRGAPLT